MSQDHRLYIGSSFDALWTGGAEHWFRNTCAASWALEGVFAVLVPSRAHGFFLKSRFLEREIPFAGIQFWTPGECRDALVARLKHRPVAGVREHLHLLLAAAAEQETSPLGQSVARDPSGLMRALDALSAAGLPWTDLPHAALHPVIARFEQSLEKLGWTTVQHIDRLLFSNKEKAIDRILIIGFDGAHWPFWNLLQAAVGAAVESTVCLTAPRYKSEQLDQAWIGSWEQVHGEAVAVEEFAEIGRFAELSERMEFPDAGGEAECPAVIRIGHDLREQARAAAAQALAFLADEDCTRLGILLPAYGALSREIAAELRRHDVAFNDTIGHNAPAPSGVEGWRAWIGLQRAPELSSLIEFIRHASGPEPLTFERTVLALTRAAGEVLVHDLPILAAYLKDAKDEKDRAVGFWLSGFVYLPDRATLAEFIQVISVAFPDRAGVIARGAGAMPAALTGQISKSTFLAWLDGAMNRPFRLRDPASTHPFARVHLLNYTQAEGQRWSHIIMTGLNEGVWPPRQEPAPFLSDTAIDAINRGALQQGKQGEGHLTVKPGRALLLGPAQRRALLQRQFYTLVESAAHGLCLTASMTDESDPSRRLLPSEYLTYLFYVQHREPLSDAITLRVQEHTAQWLEQLATTTQPADVAATRDAFLARRDASQPFGPYEFSLSKPPARAPAISCKAWEDIVRAPAIQWLNLYCDVRCLDLDPDDDGRALTRGTWIHRWLSHGGVDAAAQETRARIARAFASGKRNVPDRWVAGWRDALWIAQRLAAQLQVVHDWPRIETELTLPDKLSAGGLRLRGRIDLLLTRGDSACWIIDYKTGTTKPLSSKNLRANIEKGSGIQLALYVLALAAQGKQDIAASLLTPDEPLAPQIYLNDVTACSEVWKELRRMQDTGRFGMREELRPEFGRGPAFPLATLEIDADILDTKWSLTHPQLSKNKEEEPTEHTEGHRKKNHLP